MTSTTDFTAELRAEEEADRGKTADPGACGTCRWHVSEGRPVEHEGCAARATILKAPDHPSYEVLVDLTAEEKAALPARFHTPVFDDCGQPNAWLCSVCWGDAWVTAWPCATATKHGAEVFTREHEAEQQQKQQAADLKQARLWAVEMENRVERLTDELNRLVARASRVASSHRNFMEDHSDPGTEAIGAQYELVNHLATLPQGDELPVNTVESALGIVLGLLDEYEDNITPAEIRAAITKALPQDGVDNRRRIYLDGKGRAWISACTDHDGTEYVVEVEEAAQEERPVTEVRAETGSLREIGRTW